MTKPADPADNLARNVRALRETRGLTQKKLADLSGVPRATWANLETGAANPTLAVLVRVAAALQVSIEELIGPPRAAARLYREGTLPVRLRGRVRVGQVLPDPMSGLRIERMALPPGAGMTGVPHTAGTREYLACETGRVEAHGERREVAPVTGRRARLPWRPEARLQEPDHRACRGLQRRGPRARAGLTRTPRMPPRARALDPRGRTRYMPLRARR